MFSRLFLFAFVSVVAGISIDPFVLYPPNLQPTQFHPKFFLLKQFNLGNLTGAQTIQSCTTNSGVTGSCINFFGCIFKGGLPSGKCAFGLKSCCEGASVTSLPFATLRNPTTSLTIRRTSIAYCQIRVDFTDFNVGSVDMNGLCVGGTLTVTGHLVVPGTVLSDQVPSAICGLNTGQHIYLNFDTSASITLTINNPGASDTWNLEVTQIPCSDTENLAPAGCLQYFPGTTGNVRSFNYQTITDTDNAVTYQPANHDYIVCVDKSPSSLSRITWTRDMTTPLSFTITSVVPLVSDFLGNISAATFGVNCTTDYVGIPGGRFTNFFGAQEVESRFCGLGFPAMVVSNTTFRPFTLTVFTDGSEASDRGNVGFSLNFAES